MQATANEIAAPEWREPRPAWKFDFGQLVTLCVVILGFAAQYGALSTRVAQAQEQAVAAIHANEKLTDSLHTLDTHVAALTQELKDLKK